MSAKFSWFTQWVRRHIKIVTIVSCVAVIGAITSILSFAASPNVTVNFNDTITTLAPGAFSGTISTYGGQNIVTSTKQSNNLRNLDLGIYRIPIQYNGGNPISSAGGGPKNISAYAWIQAIKNMGAQPEIVVGGTSDDNFSPQDAQNLVKYFNTPGTNHYSPVHYWLIGNEPDNHGMSLTDNNQYCSLYNAAVPLMKQVDPTILVGGPTIEQWSQSELQNFLNCTPSQNVDIVDWHAYAMGGNVLSDSDALNDQAPSYEANFDTLRNMITQKYGAARSAQIQMSVGEYNWSWQLNDGYQGGWMGGGADTRFFEPIAGIWAASVAGHTAKAGARSHQYSDQNGALGITFDDSEGNVLQHYGRTINDPMPEYWALAMYTGANLFRGFGTSMVSATSNIPGVEAYASNNNKNIVLINKSPSTQEMASVGLTGFGGGSADIWQTNPGAQFSAPTKINTVNNVTDTVSVNLPAYSITTIVLNDGSTSGGGGGGGTQQAPTISNVAANNVTTSATTVSWSTNQPSTSQIEYGTSTVYGSTTTEDKNLVTTHQVGLVSLQPNTTYHYRVISTNSMGQTTASADYAFTTASTTTGGGGTGGGGTGGGGGGGTPSGNLAVPFRINVGGGAYTDKNGHAWLADTDFSGGSTDNQAAGKAIAGTSVPSIYQDERYGKTFGYSLPIANGTYNLQLDFAEIYPGCLQPGCRVFNVSVNGSQWLSGLDIASKVGDYTALTESQNVTVTNGKITLAFAATTGAAQLAGIEVTPQSSTPLPPSAQTGSIVGIAGMCLDDKTDQQQNGNTIQLYGCNHSPAQTWSLPGDGSIHLSGSNYCLDVLNSGTAPGTTVQLYGCNGTNAQQWVVNGDGSIVNPHSGLCLDDQHSGTGNGNPIWIWSCNGSSAQKWTITP